MAPYGWRKGRPVAEGLYAAGHRFDFYQAVRLLEWLYPDRTAPGEGIDPSREAVRFRSRVALDFPATEIDRIDRPHGPGEPTEILVNLMGLAGVAGPLPEHVTELILERNFRGDTAFRDFLDIFNNRLVSIFYRARKKYRPVLQGRSPQESRVAECLFGLLGLGTSGLRGRIGVRDRALLPYTGLMAPSPRSMIGLERMLTDYFGVPIEVVPFKGRWLPLEADQWTRIGETGKNQILGRGALLGRRIWAQQESFELRVGPLPFARFLDFLPIGRAFRAACAMTRFYVGDELSFAVRLVLVASDVPPLRLGIAGDTRLGWSLQLAGSSTSMPTSSMSLGGEPVHRDPMPRLGTSGGARLGWTSWLATRPTVEDDSQVVLTARFYAASFEEGPAA